ncbi:MAG TPA: PEP-CTERM sorting domain-containing protein [Rhodopila sp.]|nr:PEP-CTERM sorting domain-containing protein [Rhodopila sp.]
MRKIIAASVGALSFAVMASPRAATITTNLSDWEAAVGGTFNTTTDFGYGNGASASSVSLIDGTALGFGFDMPTIYNTPGTFTLLVSSGGGTTTYNGQVADTGFADETISVSPSVYALGFFVQPGAKVVSDITVTLSDSTGTTLSAVDFTGNGATQFIGYYGGNGINSIEVSFGDTDDIIDFALGDVVDVVSAPEPMSMALLLSGMTGLGLIRRRHA